MSEEISLLSEIGLPEFHSLIPFFSAFIDNSSLCLRVSVVKKPG